MNVSDILFQFTPLREGRQFQPHKLMVASNFNSRPSARGDVIPTAYDYFLLGTL